MKKRGYYYSLDALIAVILIFSLVMVIKPINNQSEIQIQSQHDLINTLSTLKIENLNSTYAQALVSEGKTTPNATVLEQILEFYAKGQPEAQLLTQDILSTLNSTENIGIWFNNQLVTNINTTSIDDAEKIWVSRQIVSGLDKPEDGDTQGYSARAFLLASNPTEYFYFGGYVGDGNLTLQLNDSIIALNLEAVISSDFDLYINNELINTYNTTNETILKLDLTNQSDKFDQVTNTLEFRSNDPLYIAGGFLKITRNQSIQTTNTYTKSFPGISGVVNLYDSLNVPGDLTSMLIKLHVNTTLDMFLNIGNTTVYRGNTSGLEQTITIDNSQLSSMLDYSTFSQNTIPLRLGLFNVSYDVNITKDADVFSVTDLSGSMQPSCEGTSFWCCLFSGDFCGSTSTCNSCGGTVTDDKITEAKEANKDFVDFVLNYSENKVGLVGYSDTAAAQDYHELSQDNVSLNSKIDDWDANGATCICCGINKGVEELLIQSPTNNFRSLVVMSDGEANRQCSEQGTGNAKQDAIQAACDAFENHEIKVYAVGFGSDADGTTLQSIADCGEGAYYQSEVGNLSSIYEQIADEIVKATFFEQTVVSENVYSKLFADSGIELTFDKQTPYGSIISLESDLFGNTISSGSFDLPNDSQIVEASIISYTGSKWTDLATINGVNIFNLSKYGSNFLNLGDPYVVTVPAYLVQNGTNNVTISSSVDGNISTGSPSNKVIYTILKNAQSFSPIVASLEGCTWSLEFDDLTTLDVSIPSNYSGSNTCSYSSSSVAYNENDAYQNAVYLLLKELDFDFDNRIDSKFSENDLEIDLSTVTNIPFTYSGEVQVRIWR